MDNLFMLFFVIQKESLLCGVVFLSFSRNLYYVVC